MLKHISDKYLPGIVIGGIFILQLVLLIFNEVDYGGADNISHFQIARYAFKYPHLFLDHWGKPLYTALSAPFAQLGYNFAKFFNVLCGSLTLYISYKIGRTLFPRGSIYLIPLIAFAPVYFQLMPTCLTEVLFSLALVSSVYAFVKKKYILAAILLSFIPFVRNEGIVLFAIFSVAFLLRRSYLSILFLTTGTIVYSIIGYFVFNDFLWIINRFPHALDSNIYGSGEWYHFLKNSIHIFGLPFMVFAFVGLVIWLIDVLKDFSLSNDKLILFIVIVGSWTAYFAAHSFVWWQGISSLGLVRVIGGVLPLTAITAIFAFQLIYQHLANKKLAGIILLLVIIAQMGFLWKKKHFPTKAAEIDTLILEASNYLKTEKNSSRVYYFNPQFVFHLGFDPYDSALSSWGIGDRMQPSNSMKWGDVLVWDAHFGPNEGQTSIEVLENDPYLKRIEAFYPMSKITVLGGYDYSIQLFEKSTSKNNGGMVSSKIEKSLNLANFTEEFLIEDGEGNAWELTATQEYSPGVYVSPKEIEQKTILDFNVGVNFLAKEKVVSKEVLLVLAIDDDGNTIRYEKAELVSDGADWKHASIEFRIPASLSNSAIIKAYVWNKDKKNLLIKNLTISIKGS